MIRAIWLSQKGFAVFTFFVLLWCACASAMQLTADDAIRIAAKQNPAALAAKCEYDQARAKAYEAFTTFLPAAKLSSSYTRLDKVPQIYVPPLYPGGEAMTFDMGRPEVKKLSLQVVEPVSAQIFFAHSLARTGAEEKRISWRKAQTDAAASALSAYYRFVQAKNFEQIAKTSNEQLKNHLTDVENMRNLGMLHKKAALKVRVNYDETELMLLQAQNAVRLAHDALCMALGFPHETELTTAETLTTPNYTMPLETALRLAETSSHDAQLLQTGLRAAKQGHKLAISGLLPSFAAIFAYSYDNPDRENNYNWYESWTATASAEWEIFGWGTKIAKIYEAKRAVSQIQYIRENALSALRLATRAAHSTIDEKRQKLTITDRQLETATEAYKVTDELFVAGAATNTEVIDAEAALTRARIGKIDALAELNIAVCELQKLTGELETKIATLDE